MDVLGFPKPVYEGSIPFDCFSKVSDIHQLIDIYPDTVPVFFSPTI